MLIIGRTVSVLAVVALSAALAGHGSACHPDEILRLHGESRGRGAEYWGQKYEDTAVWLIKNDVPARSKKWYDAQDPAFKADLDAFTTGMNDYGAAHPDAIDSEVRIVLPAAASTSWPTRTA